MTKATTPVAQLTTLDDLSRTERDRVLAELGALDFDALASAAGMTRAELEMMPVLYGRRGKFRTPYALLAAVCGYGHEGGPAASLGEVLRRLGFTVNAKTGLLDKGNYHRAREAAAFFGIPVPDLEKDGPAVGESARADVERFTAAWHQARTSQELTALLGQAVSGKTYARNRARGRELGLPDKFATLSRRPATLSAA